jgi:hypothetical protein
MAPLKDELADWLGDLRKNGELDDKDTEALEGILGRPKNLALVRKSVLATSEFSRKMDDLKGKLDAATTKEAELQQKWQENDQFGASLKEFETRSKAAIRERNALEKQVIALAEANGADPEVDWGFKLHPASGDGDPATDGRGRRPITRGGNENRRDEEIDDSQKSIDELRGEVRLGSRFNTMIADIQAEHMELFGKPLKNVTGLLDQALKQKKGVYDLWLEREKVVDRRTELETKNREAHDKEVGERAVENFRSTQVADPLTNSLRSSSPEDGSPILNAFQHKKGVAEAHPEEKSIAGAVEAFRAGKYRQGLRGITRGA